MLKPSHKGVTRIIMSPLSNILSSKLVFLSPDKEELYFQVDGKENKRKLQTKHYLGADKVSTVTYKNQAYHLQCGKLQRCQLRVTT